uniref:F-box domain-containing protein n=1 Tax=Mycena chlorophos TaxID=658473 RepID=A0ABQ0LSE7_MYCCL|nr:predicted protein [Mycena chlorophos]
MVFPPEVSVQIASNLVVPQLLVLCRVSRAFRTAAERVLYHDVDLRQCNRRRLKSLFLAMKRHEHLPSLVRKLALGEPTGGYRPTEMEELCGILKRCVRLRVLDTVDVGEGFVEGLAAQGVSLPALRTYKAAHDALLHAPPASLKLLILHYFDNEDRESIVTALSSYSETLDTLVVLMHEVSNIKLVGILEPVALALPRLRRLCISPPQDDRTPNLRKGGPYHCYQGEALEPIFAALSKFSALESLVFHLRAQANLEFFWISKNAEQGRTRTYALGYPHKAMNALAGNVEDVPDSVYLPLPPAPDNHTKGGDDDDDDDDNSDDGYDSDESEEKRIPKDEYRDDFGCEIMLKACPTLRRVDLGIETYPGQTEVSCGPQVYVLTPITGASDASDAVASGLDINIERYRPAPRPWQRGQYSDAGREWGWSLEEEKDKWC